MPETTSVRVRCQGHLHTIVLKGNKLTFPDHDYKRFVLETELRELAKLQPSCRCGVVLLAWRAKDTDKLPAGLHDAVRANRQKSVKRSWDDNAELHALYFQTLRATPRDRLCDRIKRQAESALEEASYRRSQSSWAGGHHDVAATVTDDQPTIEGNAHRVWSKNGKWSGNNSHVRVRVTSRWLSRVYRRGIALVETKKGDRLFVLDVLKEKPRGRAIVLLGKQGRGFEVNAAKALIEVKNASVVHFTSA